MQVVGGRWFEAVADVESARLIVECVHEAGAYADLLGGSYRPRDRIAEQTFAQPAALMLTVDCEAG